METAATRSRGSRNLLCLISVALLVAGIPKAGNATDAADISLETAAPYYAPSLAVVLANQPVRWINATASPHSVRHDGCLTGETCAFQSIVIPPDSRVTIAPLPAGRYAYHCELHPLMRGTLVVMDLPRAEGEHILFVAPRTTQTLSEKEVIP